MLKHILMTSAAMTLVIGTAVAQDANTTTPQAPATQSAPSVPQPPAANAPDNNAAPAELPADQAPSAQSIPAAPPPSDAIIAAQDPNEVRADTLIGMTVYNKDGTEVGKIKDILVDKDGKANGVVLSVGGVLGIGAKSVGLNWKELDVDTDAKAVEINYTKEQLEVAPDFKTQETLAEEARSAQFQSEQPKLPPPAPQQ